MRIFTIIFCVFLSMNALGQVKDTTRVDSSKIVFHERSVSSNKLGKPLYVVDGVIYTKNLNSIRPADIESISILKGVSAIALYGTAGANGVVLITMKQSWRAKHNHGTIVKPLIVLNGIIFKGDIKTIDPKTIESVSVLKADKATPIWGRAGASGAVIITTKAAASKFRPDTIR